MKDFKVVRWFYCILAAFIILCAGSVSVYAATTVTTTGGATSMVQNQAAVIVDSGVTVVNDAGNITGGKVSITSGFASGDTLACTNTGTITCSYNATTGILTFTGTDTPANWQAIFRTVTIATTSASTTARTVAFTIGSAIPYSGNGHFYEYISTTGTWTAGKAAAAARTLFGLQGYLATITSQAENDFIQQKLGADAWIGASDEYTQINAATGAATYANQAAAEGHWYWVTGPVGEIGTNFSNGNSPTVTVVTYANWNSGEPNNSGGTEHYGEIYSTGASGKWNDLPNTSSLGYVVEYGGLAGDPVVTLTASKTVNNTPSYTVTYNGNTNTGGSAPVDGSSPYASGATVTVSGAGTLVKTGYTFAGWNTAANGSGIAYAVGATFAIAANTTLYAQWTITTYTLTVTKAGTGTGTVSATGCTLSWLGNTGTCTVNDGTSITLSGSADSGSTFGGWSGGSGSASSCSGTSDCTFSITADSGVTATFSQSTYTVTATGNGTGTVASGTGGISYTYQTSNTGTTSALNHGTSLTLTATAGTGSTVSWTTCSGTTGGTTAAATCTYSSLDGNKTAQATFTLNTYTVTANATGNGSGTVASDTGGISYTYQTSNTGTTSAVNYGTSVVITATGGNSTVSWSGTCTAAGGVEAGNGTTTATCTFSSLNSNKTATATFSSTVTVPTMSEWGMLIFMLLAGIGSMYYLRRRRA